MIAPLDLVVTGANVENLPTIEQISNGYQYNGPMAHGDDSPKLFARRFLCTDYLVEAAKYWQNQVLVDLGCGRHLDGYIVAKIAGARAYVAVDPYNLSRFYQRLNYSEESKGDKEFNEKVQRVREFVKTIGYDEQVVARIVNNIDDYLSGKHLPVALVAEDMVTALRRLPKDSVSIMTAGLDNCIIWGDEYAELAEEEITRVLHPQGAYLAMCSRLMPKKLIIDPSFEEDNSFRKFTKT